MGLGRVIQCPTSSSSLHIPKLLANHPSLPSPTFTPSSPWRRSCSRATQAHLHSPSKPQFPDEDEEEERVGAEEEERTRCCTSLGDPKGLTRQPAAPFCSLGTLAQWPVQGKAGLRDTRNQPLFLTLDFPAPATGSE